MSKGKRVKSECVSCGASLPPSYDRCPYCGTFYAKVDEQRGLPPTPSAPERVPVVRAGGHRMVPPPTAATDPTAAKAVKLMMQLAEGFNAGCGTWSLCLLAIPATAVGFQYGLDVHWGAGAGAGVGVAMVLWFVVLGFEFKRDNRRWKKEIRPALYHFMKKQDVTRDQMADWAEEHLQGEHSLFKQRLQDLEQFPEP